MDLNSIYSNRPYLFDITKNDEDGVNLAKTLFGLCGFSSMDNVELIGNNLQYDCYKGEQNGRGYCLKYSMDESSAYLNQEADILSKLYPFSPQKFYFGLVKYGEPIKCLITSYEYAESVKSFGESIVISKFDSFLESFQKLSEVKTSKTFAQYLTSILDSKNINNFPSQTLDAIAAHSDMDRILNIMSDLQKEIMYLARPSLTKRQFCCHGSLQPSNILVNNELFKFIDLGHSYAGNPFLDLARLFFYIGLPDQAQKRLIEKYCEFNDINCDSSIILEFNSCQQLMSRIIFYELVFDYCSEVYLFASSRPQKILELISLFAKNNNQFLTFPAVFRHKDFILKDLMEPIIGSHAGPNPA